MASLPSQHPTLSLHLADDALTPLITSSRSRAHLESLTALTTSALTSQTAAQRVGLGAVERIMVEYPEPAAAAVVLQSYLHVPDATTAVAAASTETAPAAAPVGGSGTTSSNGEEGGGVEQRQDALLLPPPRLVGVVVAKRPQDAREAKRAAARLERVGREFQSQWHTTSDS